VRAAIISSLYSFDGGGAGLTAYYLAQGLKETGWHVSVVTLSGDQLYSLTDEDGINVYRIRPLNLYTLEEKDNHPRWQKILWQIWDIYNIDSAKGMGRVLKEISPDIIHIHKMRGFSGSVWSVAARKYPGRVIQTCHDYESMSPDGLLRGSIGRLALERKWPLRAYQLIRARLSAGVSKLVAPSRFTLDRITDSGLFPNAHASVVPNSHGWSSEQLQAFHKQESSLLTDKFRFLFLGRLEHEKGILTLCEAFLKAYESNPGIELNIAGWGSLETQLLKSYEQYPCIKILGILQGKSKEEALVNTSVVVIPSLVEEVFGLVTVEAFAFGKPVIASQVGGLPELVHVHETGWLVPPGDVDALAEQMLFVAKLDPAVLKKMSLNCKEYSNQFAVERVVREYLNLYGQMTE
jgi:glycosyltransferase involved in cell wall biosynthesis